MIQYAIALDHAPSYAPEDLLRNPELDACLEQMARYDAWPEPVMLLVGAEACGKTHLLHCLAAQTTAVFLELGSAPMDQLFHAGRLHMIDQADQQAEPAQVAQAINHARAGGFSLLLAARAATSDLPDLQSRLAACNQIVYPEADDALFEMVLMKHFSDLQWRVAPEVVRYLVTRLPRSFAAHRRFVAYADAQARQQNRPLTMPFARGLLEDFNNGEGDGA